MGVLPVKAASLTTGSGWYKPTNNRATVLLPQPDSPTKASGFAAFDGKTPPRPPLCSQLAGLGAPTRG
jgi:hypothetical protein